MRIFVARLWTWLTSGWEGAQCPNCGTHCLDNTVYCTPSVEALARRREEMPQGCGK